MRKIRRLVVLLAAGVFLCPLIAQGQDSPSLGDAARQARLQKQQQKDADDAKDGLSKDAPAKDSSTKSGAAKKDAPSKETVSKDSPSKDAADLAPPKMAKRVITNDEIPEHIGPTRAATGSQNPTVVYEQPTYTGPSPAEYWKAQIMSAKNYLATLQNNINSLNDSIRYASGNCVSGCVQWNERQQQKQAQVEAMKAQLEEGQKRLEEFQEMARKQGFGSSVYDP